MYGILTGMGFIGAYRRYEIVTVLSLINFLIFQFSEPLRNNHLFKKQENPPE